MTYLLILLALLPVWILACLGETAPVPGTAARVQAFVLGALMMGACWLMEMGLVPFLPVPAAIWKILVIPGIEEGCRWFVVAACCQHTVSLGALAGGGMGIAETLIKQVGTGLSPAALVFRALFSVPLHALNGGLLARGGRFFVPAFLLHAGFNAGTVVGGGMGVVIAAGALCGGGFLWLRGFHRPGNHPVGD